MEKNFNMDIVDMEKVKEDLMTEMAIRHVKDEWTKEHIGNCQLRIESNFEEWVDKRDGGRRMSKKKRLNKSSGWIRDAKFVVDHGCALVMKKGNDGYFDVVTLSGKVIGKYKPAC